MESKSTCAMDTSIDESKSCVTKTVEFKKACQEIVDMLETEKQLSNGGKKKLEAWYIKFYKKPRGQVLDMHESNSFSPIQVFNLEYSSDFVLIGPGSLYQDLIDNGCERSWMRIRGTNYSPESGYIEVAVEYVLDLFKSMMRIQSAQFKGEKKMSYVPTKMWSNVMKDLKENGHLRLDHYRPLICLTRLMDFTSKEYRKDLSDIQKLAIAFYYLEKGDKEKFMYWLGQSTLTQQLSEDTLSTIVNKISGGVYSLSLFHNTRLAKAVASSGKVTTIEPSCITNYDLQDTTLIGEFLELSSSVTELSMQSTWSHRDSLTFCLLQPVVRALEKTKSSITSIDMSDTRIGEEGAIAIIQAIDKNPNIGTLKWLNFYGCGLNHNKNVEAAIQNCDKITWSNVNLRS